jgi:hypothetical protein
MNGRMGNALRMTAAAFAIAIALLSVVHPATAQIMRPEPINTPVQDQWREPFEQFLRDLGVSDPATIVRTTYAFKLGGVWRPDSILFRIEDSAVCSGDSCLTVIGRIIDNKLHSDAMFTAGKRFTRSDHTVPVFGSQSFPAMLVGDRMTVTLFETANGWLVASAPRQQGDPF